MGESSDTPLKRQYDRRVRLDFRGATITSDAGLLACRELDAALGLTETANDYIHESRTGRNVQHPLLPLHRQSVYSRLAGYEDTNDAERLAQDPAMRVIVGWQGTDKQAGSTNTMSRFETEVLTEEENLDGLARLNVEWVDRAMAQTSHQRVILDMDSSESPVHGQQEGVAYNGHFESVSRTRESLPGSGTTVRAHRTRTWLLARDAHRDEHPGGQWPPPHGCPGECRLRRQLGQHDYLYLHNPQLLSFLPPGGWCADHVSGQDCDEA